jgi:EAL domain-containing protein (putative c-di-GMP-specific phosphodiesterase class I)
MTAPPAVQATWVDDPAGFHFIRRNLLPAAGGVTGLYLVVGIALHRGNEALFLLLLLLAAAQVGLATAFARLGRRISGPQQLRILLGTTPVSFFVLAMAGWSGDQAAYYPAIPSIIAGLVAMVVALTEPRSILIPWVAASCVGLVTGAFVQAGVMTSILLPPACLAGQAGLAWLIRDGIARYHSDRRAIAHAVAALVPLPTPELTAAAIVDRLGTLTDYESVVILRFTALGQTVVVGALNRTAADGLTVGEVLPATRNELLRAKADDGPWLTRWIARPEDGAYGARITANGITAAAYVPMTHDGRTIGLVVASEARAPEDGLANLAERLPVLIEVGELAGALLGPGFDQVDATSTAGMRLDLILTNRAFTPVFQPICELDTGQVVGLEALTRFVGAGPDEVFTQAGLLGRLQELEIATLTAALEAAERLPADRWLSVNVSPGLLAASSIVHHLVGRTPRQIVLELSEHEAVGDYQALTASLARLPERVSLAIDDAGAGFSSLRHILETSPAWVKLDIGLVRGIDDDPARQALVAGLVHFARQARISLIAEGIETRGELAMLKLLGVELGQGFLLARPAPLDDAMISRLVHADRLILTA